MDGRKSLWDCCGGGQRAGADEGGRRREVRGVGALVIGGVIGFLIRGIIPNARIHPGDEECSKSSKSQEAYDMNPVIAPPSEKRR